jgi:hypothetical protein
MGVPLVLHEHQEDEIIPVNDFVRRVGDLFGLGMYEYTFYGLY